MDKPIEILNCPSGIVNKKLSDHQAFVMFSPSLEVIDHLKLRREITVTMQPNITRFWWKGTTPESYEKVTVTAKARAPDGTDQTDVCQYTVNVIGV